MSPAEVEAYIKDGLATLLILREQGSDKVERVQTNFVADLQYLVALGRLSRDDYNDIITNLNQP